MIELTERLFGRIPNIWLAKKNVLFSLLMYTIFTIYGLVKKSVMPLFIFWIIFLLDLELNFIGKLLVFWWELMVLLLLQICFFFVMREISWRLSHGKIRLTLLRLLIQLQDTMYLDDLLNIDNIYFNQMMNRIYPTKFQLNRANSSDTEAPFWIWIYVYLMIQFPSKFMINGTILILI